MNKTININLGGLSFFIDEDAYQKMTRYFAAIKRSLGNSSGQDEIIKDIEMRVAELISEKHSSDKQVISMAELDQVIAVMGQPEDYRLDNDENTTQKSTPNFADNVIGRKKLYRDRETGMIGGVLSGLGYYFGIEKIWLRLALLLLLIFGGTGFVIYIILWIVVPEAVTTSEKLEMRGEPVNLSNIEKQVRDGFGNVSEKIKNADYKQFGNDMTKAGNTMGDVIVMILGLFAKFIGVVLIIVGISTVISLLIGLLAFNSILVFDGIPWTTFLTSGGFTDYPAWLIGFLMFLSIGIPFFGVALLGLRMVVPTTNSIGNTAKYTLITVSIMATILLFIMGMQFANSFANEGRMIDKKIIAYNPRDTLNIKFIHSDYFAKDVNDESFEVTEDSLKRQVIYTNDVSIEILDTNSSKPYIEIEKSAKGHSLSQARANAEKIEYKYKIQGNNIIFDNYLLTELKNKFRDQEVNIKLYLPKGTYFKVDKSVRDYDSSDDEYFNLHYSSDNYIYKVENNKVKCLNCPPDENEYNDITNQAEDATTETIEVFGEAAEEVEPTEAVEIPAEQAKTVSLKVNGKEIIKSETTAKSTKLEINDQGIITKTK
jgi:phage shock protein PspC (stress-responsive transcriptional regulator)